MEIEVCSIGGFDKPAGNSIAIKIDDEVIILDMGLSMENYIRYTEDLEDVSSKTYTQLLKAGAVPDYGAIKDWTDKVVAIVPSHGHLDHVGAVVYSATLFPNASIICSPFTKEILKTTIQDEQIRIPNKIIGLNLNSTYKISDKITIELINVTHSIPHTCIVCVHTPYGKVIYANDYKFDLEPTLGPTPNFKRLKQIGEEGVILLIVECLYMHEDRKMPSESVARQMLKDVMLGMNSEGRAMVVTTFSSHIARLKSIIEMGRKLNRKIIFLGRSLSKYVKAAQKLGIVNFEKDVQLVSNRDLVEKMLRRISKEGKNKYLIVCTGHQGEPKAVLSKMARGETSFTFSDGDIVIFSCSVIPVELNRQNREKLESLLKRKSVRICRDVHVSGHGAREDHRDLIEMLQPKHIIPSHDGKEKAMLMKDLGIRLGFKNVHLMSDGKRISLK